MLARRANSGDSRRIIPKAPAINIVFVLHDLGSLGRSPRHGTLIRIHVALQNDHIRFETKKRKSELGTFVMNIPGALASF